jgi:hypothetical protein
MGKREKERERGRGEKERERKILGGDRERGMDSLCVQVPLEEFTCATISLGTTMLMSVLCVRACF